MSGASSGVGGRTKNSSLPFQGISMFKIVTRMLAIPALAFALSVGADSQTAEAGGFSLSIGGPGRGVSLYSGPSYGYRSAYRGGLYNPGIYNPGLYRSAYRGPSVYRSYRPYPVSRGVDLYRGGYAPGYYRSYRPSPRNCW